MSTEPKLQIVGILGDVMNEVRRALDKFPEWPSDMIHAAAIVGEEAGELTRAALQTTYQPGLIGPDEHRKEAVQVAAMAIRYLASADNYSRMRAPQHIQPGLTFGLGRLEISQTEPRPAAEDPVLAYKRSVGPGFHQRIDPRVSQFALVMQTQLDREEEARGVVEETDTALLQSHLAVSLAEVTQALYEGDNVGVGMATAHLAMWALALHAQTLAAVQEVMVQQAQSPMPPIGQGYGPDAVPVI